MKKLVTETLHEYLNEEKVKKARRQKATAKQPAKTTAVLDQSTVEKADQALKGLKADLKKEDKPGGDKAKIRDIKDKIAKWEAKKKKAQGK